MDIEGTTNLHRKKSQHEDISHEELEHVRLLRARKQFWTPSLEKLLRQWRKQICKRQRGHMKRNRTFEAYYYYLGIPMIIINAIVGTGILATFQNCSKSADTWCASSEWIRVIIGIVAIISTVLSAINVFLNYGGRAGSHKSSADSFGDLVRLIDSTLQLPVNLRDDPIVTLQKIMSMYSDICKTSLSLPEQYEDELAYNFVGKNIVVPPSPDEFHFARSSTNNIVEVAPNDTTLLKKVLNNMEKENNVRQDIIRKHSHENEVILDIDLEAARPEDAIKLAERRSILEALKFELERFHNLSEFVNKNEIKNVDGSNSNNVHIPGTQETTNQKDKGRSSP
jgi:hypothetical protein